MIKDILLDYIMGKYRKIILMIFTSIFLLSMGYLIWFNNFIFNEKFFALVLSYFSFIVAIYNGSPVGFPSVNMGSSDFDIIVRVMFIIITLSLFLYISYSIF